MKKIAFIGGLGYGGSERVTANLANEFSGDLMVYVITGDVQENEYELNESVYRKCMLKYKFFEDCQRVKRFLISEKIDSVVGMGIYGNLMLGAINGRALKTKTIIAERNDPRHDNLSIKTRILRFFLYRRADFFVFQTKEEQTYYNQSMQDRSVIIHNALKADLPFRSDGTNKEIVAVGRLMAQKNYPLLLRAFAEVSKLHPEYILRIFGQGDLEKELKRLTVDLGIENSVIFEGFKTDVHKRIENSDIYVMSSDFEGLPNSLMEAMAMGFPVISTDCPAGGPSEVIENGENGILVPVGDVKVLTKAISDLISNEELKDRIRKEAIKIRNTHSVAVITKKWREVLIR